MLGYSVEFAIIQCIQFAASANFAEKRIGYLGLTQLQNESEGMLVMIVNTLAKDLTPTN
jgi:AP-1 complex subunit gamma-1